MKKILIQNKEQLELVREEIRVSSLFNHPNLLPLLDHAIISVKVELSMADFFFFNIFFANVESGLESVLLLIWLGRSRRWLETRGLLAVSCSSRRDLAG